MNRRLKDGLRKGRTAAAVFACLAGLGASATATRAGQAVDWPFPPLDRHAAGLLAKDIQVATLDGAQCTADGLCRFNGCDTPDPDCGQDPNLPALVNLSISRHTSSTLSNTTADQILEAASEVLRTNNSGGDDVPCDVTFARSGSVGTFTTGTGSIDDDADYDAVIALPNKVKVVNQINWCGEENDSRFASFLGCAPVPGSSQIVVITGLTHKDGIVWAHEYGHTQGVNHRAAYNTRFVMNSGIEGRSTRVSSVECNAIR